MLSVTDRPQTTSVVPGVAVALLGGGLGVWIHHQVDSVSAHIVAVLVGVLVANSSVPMAALRPGFRWSGRHLVRAGVVLVGFRLSFDQLQQLGVRGVSAVAVVVTITFVGTQLLGRLLGVSPAMSLLVGTGFSICGASAIAAAEPLSDAEEHETAYAIALVTLCGTLAIATLPAISSALGLSAHEFGSWAGASVHDVGQVVATASTKGPDALSQAVVVKLTRVVMLAPLLMVVALRSRRRSADAHDPTATRPPLLPLFVVFFGVAVAIRSTVDLPASFLTDLKELETFVLAAGLVGLGGAVELGRLRTVGGRPLALGLAAWALVATVSLPVSHWWMT